MSPGHTHAKPVLRTSILALFLLGAIVLGGIAAADDHDQFEPNDEFETARTIAPGAYSGLVIEDGESDFFAIDLAEGDELAVAIAFDHDVGDLDLKIHESTEWVAGDSESVTDDESASIVADVSGTHYVEVYGYSWESNTYDMQIAVNEGLSVGDAGDTDGDTDEFDGLTSESDVFEGAEPISAGVYTDLATQNGEGDYYAIDLAEGDELNVSIAFDHAGGDIDLAVHDPSEWEIAYADSVTDDESVSIVAEESGTYYVRVYGWFGATNAYDMRVAVNGQLDTGSDSDGLPGPGIVGALTSLAGASYLLKRRAAVR